MRNPYAKFIGETAIDRNLPRHAEWNGRNVSGDITVIPGLPESLGFLPLSETPAPETVREGWHWEARYAYDDAGTPTRIVQTWVEVEDPPAPPRVFSKLKVLEAAEAQGVAPALLSALSADPLLMAKWNAASVLREDNPSFAAGLELAARATGLSVDVIRDALASCLYEPM